MTPERFRALIDGTLALWQADAHACFDAAEPRCRIVHAGRTLARVGHEHTALGGVWRVEAAGRTARVHRSVVAALATLREAVCPQRARGRVLFVSAPPGDAEEGR